MKTKEIVRLTISYTDEFTFDDLRAAMTFLKLWKKGRGNIAVKATVEIVEVPIAIEDDKVTVEVEPVPTIGVDF